MRLFYKTPSAKILPPTHPRRVVVVVALCFDCEIITTRRYVYTEYDVVCTLVRVRVGMAKLSICAHTKESEHTKASSPIASCVRRFVFTAAIVSCWDGFPSLQSDAVQATRVLFSTIAWLNALGSCFSLHCAWSQQTSKNKYTAGDRAVFLCDFLARLESGVSLQ